MYNSTSKGHKIFTPKQVKNRSCDYMYVLECSIAAFLLYSDEPVGSVKILIRALHYKQLSSKDE